LLHCLQLIDHLLPCLQPTDFYCSAAVTTVYKVELCPGIRPRRWHRTATEQTRTRVDMHASNSLTFPPLLNLHAYFFLRGGVGGLFLWLGARHNKRGDSRPRRYRSSRRRNDDQRRAPSDRPLAAAGAAGRLPALRQPGIAIYPSQQQELQDCCMPHVNQHRDRAPDARFFFFLFFLF